MIGFNAVQRWRAWNVAIKQSLFSITLFALKIKQILWYQNMDSYVLCALLCAVFYCFFNQLSKHSVDTTL